MPRLHRRRIDTPAENDRSATILRRLVVGVVAAAVMILLAAVVSLVLLVTSSTDAALRQAEENGRLAGEVKTLVERQTATDLARDQVVDGAITTILAELRLSIDCATLREQGRKPEVCAAVNGRIDALARGETPPGLAKPRPTTPTATTTTTRPQAGPPGPRGPAGPPGPTTPTTRPLPPTAGPTPPATVPCRSVSLLGLCPLG